MRPGAQRAGHNPEPGRYFDWMTRSLASPRPLLIVGLPAALVAFCAIIATRSAEALPGVLGEALVLDLLVTLPLLYGALIWRTRVPKLTIATALLAGVASASALVGRNQSVLLGLALDWGVPLLEVSALLFVGLRVRRYVQTARGEASGASDFLDTLRGSVAETLPRPLSAIVATEIAVAYYAFHPRRPLPLEAYEFSCHRGNGVRTTLTAFGFVVVLEVVLVHLLLHLWSPTLAWIATAISVYAGIQLLAVVRSLARRRSLITNDTLILRAGLLGAARVPLSCIVSIEQDRKALRFKGDVRQLSALGVLDPHNVVLKVHGEHELIGFYGIRRRFTTLAFHVDEPARLVAAVDARLEGPGDCQG